MSASEPFISRTLSLAHHLLQFFEAGTVAAPRNDQLASLLRRDPALLGNFLDTVSHLKPVPPRSTPGRDWLTGLLRQLPETSLQQFALESATPWLTLELDDDHWLLLRNLHERSHCVAEIARELARHCDDLDPDEAWLAGTMHNLGKLMLFSRSPDRFLSARSPVLLGMEALEGERKLWGCDHLELACHRTERWPLDSYLHDAVTLLYEEPEQYACATALVKVLHCAERLSRQDELRDADAHHVRELLDIDRAELQAVMFHARESVRQLKWQQLDEDTFCARQQEAVLNLRNAVGSLAGRQLARAELLQSADESALLETAVAQLRRYFNEAFIFTLDADRRCLSGRPVADQPGRLAGMKPRFQPGDNLPAHALLEGETVDSIHTEEFALSLLDRQLLTLTGGAGFCCLPLVHRRAPVGVAVVRLADAGQRAQADHPRVRDTLATLAGLLTQVRGPTAPREDTVQLMREMHHELGNPLSAVRNHLHVLKRKGGEELRDILARVEADIGRVSELLNQYRQRLQNRRQDNESTDINRLARETIARVAGGRHEARTIEADLDPDLPAIKTNRLAVQQILTNLLDNALEATGPDSLVRVITRGNWRAGERSFAEIQVSDNGPGIPESILGQLFLPVSSTKGGDHSGLGLAIVKSLADEIGAIVHCHSDNHGTRFQILIPVYPCAPDNNENRNHANFPSQSITEH